MSKRFPYVIRESIGKAKVFLILEIEIHGIRTLPRYFVHVDGLHRHDLHNKRLGAHSRTDEHPGTHPIWIVELLLDFGLECPIAA